MSRGVRALYAYPDKPADLGETIKQCIRTLESRGVLKKNDVQFKRWRDLSVSGRPLETTILRQIDRHQIFACDLTYPNLNVSFELGYAIARFKRVLASVNPGILNAQSRYSRIYQNLLNMGYLEYNNHAGLSQAILQESPWNNLEQTFLDSRLQPHTSRPEQFKLVYVKPPLNTDSVISTHEAFERSVFGQSLLIDDPIEFPSQSLEWYAEHFLTAHAIAVHFLSNDQVYNNSHNLKASVIAGLALGLKKPTIILAHAPYKPPADYGRWLQIHDTARECVTRVNNWLSEVTVDLADLRSRRGKAQVQSLGQLSLRTLFLGDIVAELEADDLHEYFVRTASYNRAVENQCTILLGRRGTGKTAILYAIASQISNTSDNHLTVLKPVGYETHGLIRVLKELQERSERGFLIESLWKFLIYSEIATTLKQQILDRPAHLDRTTDEDAFLDYYESKSHILSPPFSERIERALSSLKGIGGIADAGEKRRRISEELHDLIISRLRNDLGNVLSGKRRLTVLIDGLDGPWAPGEHIVQLAELIGGLLDVVQSVPKEFGKSSSSQKPVDARIVVVLRSDIFAFIRHRLPEQDKLPIERVTWSDRELLLRVLDERMRYRASRQVTPKEVWSAFFPESVNGIECADFMLRSVLPRPRDLIDLSKLAVNSAINRGHDRVLPEDIMTAREQYSQRAFESVLNEDDPSKGKLEEVLYEFAGRNSKFKREEIESRFALAGVKEKDMDSYIDLLCDINFLGIETANGFRMADHEEDRRTLRNFARVIASRENRSEEYTIGPAFHPVLGIQ